MSVDFVDNSAQLLAEFRDACERGLWRCGERTAAARLEYAIKKHLSHQQKQGLAAAPETLGELLPQAAGWGVTAENVEIFRQSAQ